MTNATVIKSDPVEIGDRLYRERRFESAAESYSMAAARLETVPSDLCLKLAHCYQKLKDYPAALRWALATVENDDYAAWQGAAQIAREAAAAGNHPSIRVVRRAALLGSYTTTTWAPLLQLAALRFGVRLDLVHQCPYGQYRQEVLDDLSGLYASQPDLVVLAIHEKEIHLPELSPTPAEDIEREVARWTSLWDRIAERTKATIVQHNFATPAESPLGHLAGRLPGSRVAMMQEVNRQLGLRAEGRAVIVDCDRLSSIAGKRRWFEPRYWHLSKQAVSPEFQPTLARHTAAVIAASAGLNRKCIVVDLDNTLWGGVVGEDGWAGIRLGHGADGEAFGVFQEYLLALKQRGVLLAVVSKNNEADAREPFLKNPAMRLHLDDFAAFAANWRPKDENIREIARTLDIGLNSLVFLDDNPAERQAIRLALPEVEVPILPSDPAGFVRKLADCLTLEPASITMEDTRRTEMYQARARASAAQSEAPTIEDYYRTLKMEARIAPFNAFDLPRIAQLVGKTNQFNVTTRRHSMAHLIACMEDPKCVHLSLRLRDCYDDHGLVGVLIAREEGEALEVDTFLMSCRVIGRTAERALLSTLCAAAEERGCRELVGVYLPTAKNALVKDLYARLGFEKVSEDGTYWRYDLVRQGPIRNDFIQLTQRGKDSYEHTRAPGRDHSAACQ
jgi:FkbH-like protein